MSARQVRPLRTTAVLLALVVFVVIIGWWGVHELTRPFTKTTASDSPTCSKAETTHKRYVKSGEVTVSVYNAGAPQGFARLTLQRLEARGFNPGEVANAPTGTEVTKAQVLTTDSDSAAAKLVAANLGKHVQVEVVDEEFGPGIDVVVGKKMGKLRAHAPKRMKLATPITKCVRVD